MNGEQYTIAREILQELQERFPQSGQEVRRMQRRADDFWLIEQAERALEQDAIEEADKYYRQAIRTILKMKKPDLYCKVLKKQYPGNTSRRWIERGQQAIRTGDWEVAVHAFEEVLAYEQDNRQALSGLREAEFQWESTKEREPQIQKLLDISHKAIDHQVFEDARRNLDEAYRSNPPITLRSTDYLQNWKMRNGVKQRFKICWPKAKQQLSIKTFLKPVNC